MTGLQKILKRHGKMKVGDVLWQWDYATDQPRIASEMTPAEKRASTQAERNQLLTPAVSTGA